MRSDHAALARKLSKSAHDPPISPRQARWIERLMPFSITFEYIPGSQNVVPDALSRYPALSTSACLTLVAPQLVGLVSRIAMAAQQDPDYVALVNKLQSGKQGLNEADGVVANHLTAKDESLQGDNEQGDAHSSPTIDEENFYTLQDGVVFTREGQILMPKEDELRTLVISEASRQPTGRAFWSGEDTGESAKTLAMEGISARCQRLRCILSSMSTHETFHYQAKRVVETHSCAKTMADSYHGSSWKVCTGGKHTKHALFGDSR